MDTVQTSYCKINLAPVHHRCGINHAPTSATLAHRFRHPRKGRTKHSSPSVSFSSWFRPTSHLVLPCPRSLASFLLISKQLLATSPGKKYDVMIQAFRAFDSNNDNKIVKNEFLQGLMKVGIDLPREERER